MKLYGVRPQKKLGQNFLVDESYISRIIGAADIQPDEVVLEVGAGTGVLTRALARQAHAVVAVELDKRLAASLQDSICGFGNTQVVWGDILKLDLTDLLNFAIKEGRRCKAVANLPYYITSPVITRLLDTQTKVHREAPLFERLVLMVQKEVAARIAAKPGTREYGAFSVFVQYYSLPEIICYVPRGAFLPQPKVDSAVVLLRVRREPGVSVSNPRAFFEVVSAGFAYRRKTLRNAMAKFCDDMGIPQELREEAFSDAGIDPTRRAETLSLSEFAGLTEALVSRYDFMREGGSLSSS